MALRTQRYTYEAPALQRVEREAIFHPRSWTFCIEWGTWASRQDQVTG